MKRWIVVLAVGMTGCSAMSLQPHYREPHDTDVLFASLHTAGFTVSCDSCRVAYGPANDLRDDVTNGAWKGSTPLGALAEGETVRVELHVTPLGKATVSAAEIDLDGRTVASDDSDEPGKPIIVRARVGPR